MYYSSFGDLSLFSGKTIIQVYETKSIGDVPSIDITFSNGIKDSVVLEKYYPTQESRLEKEPSCNFFGHLKNEDTACVSLTGCPGQDDLHFTINSENPRKGKSSGWVEFKFFGFVFIFAHNTIFSIFFSRQCV